MENIIFEFKQYYRRHKDLEDIWDFSDFVNDFMFENRYYGEDIFNELMKVKID